jgi:hypothetical protein
LTAGTVAGSFTVTATVAGVTSPASFSLTNTPGSPANLAAAGGTPQSATVATAFPTGLGVKVIDAFGNPVPGATVTFTCPPQGASGSFAGSATVLTDNTGQAAAPALTANTTAGGFAVTTSVAGAGTITFALTNTVGSPASVTTVSGTPRAPPSARLSPSP